MGAAERVQEGDLRLKKEPGDTNVSDGLTKPLDQKRMREPVDLDGLRVQRRAHIVGAGSAVTNWRLKSSMSMRTIANCFQQITIRIVVSSTAFQQEFLMHAEPRSGSGILERDGRAVLGVAAYWVGGMQVFVKTMTSRSGIRDSK